MRDSGVPRLSIQLTVSTHRSWMQDWPPIVPLLPTPPAGNDLLASSVRRSVRACADCAPGRRSFAEPSTGSAQSSGIPARRNSGSVARSSARITGPMRQRWTSQQWEPGSQTPPARHRISANSRGHRTATMPPSSLNSAGPIRAGSGRARGIADSRPGPRVVATDSLYRVLDECSLTARGVAVSGFQAAMVRAHSRACTLSVTPGNSRRNSTAADNSPRCSNAARIAAASASETTNFHRAWERRPQPASAQAHGRGLPAGR
jgi:hypothetical protein